MSISEDELDLPQCNEVDLEDEYEDDEFTTSVVDKPKSSAGTSSQDYIAAVYRPIQDNDQYLGKWELTNDPQKVLNCSNDNIIWVTNYDDLVAELNPRYNNDYLLFIEYPKLSIKKCPMLNKLPDDPKELIELCKQYKKLSISYDLLKTKCKFTRDLATVTTVNANDIYNKYFVYYYTSNYGKTLFDNKIFILYNNYEIQNVVYIPDAIVTPPSKVVKQTNLNRIKYSSGDMSEFIYLYVKRFYKETFELASIIINNFSNIASNLNLSLNPKISEDHKQNFNRNWCAYGDRKSLLNLIVIMIAISKNVKIKKPNNKYREIINNLIKNGKIGKSKLDPQHLHFEELKLFETFILSEFEKFKS